MRSWRYAIPSVNLEGWAVMHVDESGVVSIVSDFGNYGHVWGAGCLPAGMTIRQFLLQPGPDYLLSKFAPEQVLNESATWAAIRAHLDSLVGAMLADELEEERVELGVQSVFDYADWTERSGLGDIEGVPVYGPHPQAVAFMQRCWPRLMELVRKDLEAEAAVPRPQDVQAVAKAVHAVLCPLWCEPEYRMHYDPADDCKGTDGWAQLGRKINGLHEEAARQILALRAPAEALATLHALHASLAAWRAAG